VTADAPGQALLAFDAAGGEVVAGELGRAAGEDEPLVVGEPGDAYLSSRAAEGAVPLAACVVAAGAVDTSLALCAASLLTAWAAP